MELLEIELFDHLTGCIYKMCLQIIYLIYMYKQDLELNNQQWLMRYETKPNNKIDFICFKHDGAISKLNFETRSYKSVAASHRLKRTSTNAKEIHRLLPTDYQPYENLISLIR